MSTELLNYSLTEEQEAILQTVRKITKGLSNGFKERQEQLRDQQLFMHTFHIVFCVWQITIIQHP